MKIQPEELREYLLGGLAEDMAIALDERLFADEDVLRDLQNEQELLIHDFVDQNLQFADEARFRAQCVRSPALQAAVEEVWSLKAVLERERDAKIPRKVLAAHRPWIFAFAAAAIALCVVSIYCLNLWRGRERADFQVAALSHQQPHSSLSDKDGHSFATVFLSANVLRGDASMPSVALPPGASLIELQVEVRAESADQGDRTVSISKGDEIVWRSLRVPLQRVGQEAFIAIVLDRGDLPPGFYEVQYAASTNPSSVTKRPFHVVSRR